MSLQISYVEILTPKEMDLEGGALGGDTVPRVEPHEADECPNKRDPTEHPQTFLHVRTQLEDSHS